MPYHYFKELLWLTVFSLTHGMCVCLFLFRLHMISEIEEFFHVLVDFPESKDNNTSDIIMLPSASDLLNNWQARIQMAQVWYMFSQDFVAKTSLCIYTCAGYTSANTATGMWSDKIWHILAYYEKWPSPFLALHETGSTKYSYSYQKNSPLHWTKSLNW